MSDISVCKFSVTRGTGKGSRSPSGCRHFDGVTLKVKGRIKNDESDWSLSGRREDIEVYRAT